MNRIMPQWLGRAFISISAAAALAACSGDGSVGPDVKFSTPVFASAQAADLGSCDSLAVPAGHKLSTRLYATGDQIYSWTGTTWAFVAPSAVLFPNANANGHVGTHYAGPTWESNSGSKVVGVVAKRCTPDAASIAWLQLRAASSGGPGIFDSTTFIQRINTVGGVAPFQAGSFTGEIARVPYTTEYLFYRAQ